jgi:hypothetical protein
LHPNVATKNAAAAAASTSLLMRYTFASSAEAERLQDLAQQTVRQRWQIYEEMTTRSAGDFPADARKDH